MYKMNVHPLLAADVERSNWTYLVAMDVPLMRCNALLQLTGIPPSPGSKQVLPPLVPNKSSSSPSLLSLWTTSSSAAPTASKLGNLISSHAEEDFSLWGLADFVATFCSSFTEAGDVNSLGFIKYTCSLEGHAASLHRMQRCYMYMCQVVS